MINELRAKLKADAKKFKEKRPLKWFVQNYLPDMGYSTFSSQLNGFNTLSEDVKAAIKKYLEGE